MYIWFPKNSGSSREKERKRKNKEKEKTEKRSKLSFGFDEDEDEEEAEAENEIERTGVRTLSSTFFSLVYSKIFSFLRNRVNVGKKT